MIRKARSATWDEMDNSLIIYWMQDLQKGEVGCKETSHETHEHAEHRDGIQGGEADIMMYFACMCSMLTAGFSLERFPEGFRRNEIQNIRRKIRICL